MSDVTTLCNICGMAASHVCRLCGKHACARHFEQSKGICTSCLGGRAFES